LLYTGPVTALRDTRNSGRNLRWTTRHVPEHRSRPYQARYNRSRAQRWTTLDDLRRKKTKIGLTCSGAGNQISSLSTRTMLSLRMVFTLESSVEAPSASSKRPWWIVVQRGFRLGAQHGGLGSKFRCSTFSRSGFVKAICAIPSPQDNRAVAQRCNCRKTNS
jgi:hypothetical protein